MPQDTSTGFLCRGPEMIISCSRRWTCCAKQFNACPLIADHFAVLKKKKKRKIQALHYHQFHCEFEWSEKCRFDHLLEHCPVAFGRAGFAEGPRSHTELQSWFLSCPGSSSAQGEVTILIQSKGPKSSLPFWHLKQPPISILLLLFNSSSQPQRTPVLQVQRRLKSQGNENNALPVVKNIKLSCHLVLSKFYHRCNSAKTSPFPHK